MFGKVSRYLPVASFLHQTGCRFTKTFNRKTEIMMKNRIPRIVAALLTSGLLLAAGVSVLLTARAGDQPPAKIKSMGLVVDDHPLARDARAGVSYAEVVKKVMPSVVKVEVTTAAKESAVEMPGSPMTRSSASSLAINSAADGNGSSLRPSTASAPA